MPRGDTHLRNLRQRNLYQANRERILEFLRGSPGSTRGDVRRALGLSARHCCRHINQAIGEELLIGEFQGDRWQRLRVAP